MDALCAMAEGATDPETIAEALTVLCLERIPEGAGFDPDAGFFEAGLTSRSLTEIVVLLKEHGVPVTMIDFFRQRTAGRLADELSRRLSAGEGSHS